MAKKKEKNSYLYVGLRYAFSSFKYDVSTLPVETLFGEEASEIRVWKTTIGEEAFLSVI